MFGAEQLLDPRVCDCCQTGVARTLEGIIVAYRDRSDGEVRDISSVRFDRGLWLPPANVYPDGWKINGCPVNGPSVAASGTNALAVAWFSDRNDSSQVKVALSSDGGVSYNRVVRVDGGDPIGRVAAEKLPDDSFAVAWVEKVGAGAELRVRRILPDGTMDAPVTAANTKINRESTAGLVGRRCSWPGPTWPGAAVRVSRYDWSRPRRRSDRRRLPFLRVGPISSASQHVALHLQLQRGLRRLLQVGSTCRAYGLKK